jgi:hypothetical protein
MKSLRRLCLALVLTFPFALPALAGEMQTTVAPPQLAQSATAQGELQTTVTGQEEMGSSEATATGSATETALNLLQSVLSLF